MNVGIKRIHLNITKIKFENIMLTVEIVSFSYRKGYPKGSEDHGGGFVFDCRYIHNPGRYEPYKALTGKDEEVKAFLREKSEIADFLENVWNITDKAVKKYIERDFSLLQIAFGCTGGRHRSVYSAEETAKHIKEKFPDVAVNLIHREQR